MLTYNTNTSNIFITSIQVLFVIDVHHLPQQMLIDPLKVYSVESLYTFCNTLYQLFLIFVQLLCHPPLQLPEKDLYDLYSSVINRKSVNLRSVRVCMLVEIICWSTTTAATWPPWHGVTLRCPWRRRNSYSLYVHRTHFSMWHPPPFWSLELVLPPTILLLILFYPPLIVEFVWDCTWTLESPYHYSLYWISDKRGSLDLWHRLVEWYSESLLARFLCADVLSLLRHSWYLICPDWNRLHLWRWSHTHLWTKRGDKVRIVEGTAPSSTCYELYLTWPSLSGSFCSWSWCTSWRLCSSHGHWLSPRVIQTDLWVIDKRT